MLSLFNFQKNPKTAKNKNKAKVNWAYHKCRNIYVALKIPHCDTENVHLNKKLVWSCPVIYSLSLISLPCKTGVLVPSSKSSKTGMSRIVRSISLVSLSVSLLPLPPLTIFSPYVFPLFSFSFLFCFSPSLFPNMYGNAMKITFFFT